MDDDDDDIFGSGGGWIPTNMTIRAVWDPDAPTPASTCPAEPCTWCGGCSVCSDFHFYVPGHGCTAETCPRQRSTTVEDP